MSLVCEHELKIKGSMMYKHEDYVEAVESISRGDININPMLTKAFPFDAYTEAYNYIATSGDKTLKVMINLD